MTQNRNSSDRLGEREERERREMLTGTVKEISEDQIVLIDRRDEEIKLDVSNKEDLVVHGSRRDIKYEDIKVGDNLVVYRRISGDSYVVERIRVR